MKFHQIIALLILISYSSVKAAKSYSPGIINCYINHLKAKNLLGDEIQELPSVLKITDCSGLIDNVKSELVQETMVNIKKRLEINNKEQCVEDTLSKNNILDVTFVAVVYEVLQESSDKKYEKEVNDANEKLENVIEDSVTYCLFEDDFGDIFDGLFTDDKKKEEDTETDYCARKHVLDNQLLDTSVYTLKLNPNNISTDSIDCDEKIKLLIKDIEDDLVDGTKKEPVKEYECRLNAFRRDKVSDRMMATYFFGEINMTDEQKQAEKAKFIIMMGKIAFQAVECEED
ncbi:uncharacterized protein [Chironomus tepperi]|uniref:uncharacterized protein n=1 Tax=Chironomus tepperi TaxID=113505 RepID=UPI00391F115A